MNNFKGRKATSNDFELSESKGDKSKSIIIGGTVIDMKDGMYSLNDLHRASGTNASKSPSKWFGNKATKEFIETIQIRIVTSEGRNGGTYTEKKAVYAYAMWISPIFQSQVIDVFDAVVTSQMPMQQVQPQWITNLSQEATLALNDLSEQVQAKEILIEQQAPKVEYCDKVLSSSGGLRTTEIAAELGWSAIILNRSLYNHGIQRKIGNRWVLRSEYVGRGYDIEHTVIDGNDVSRHSLLWTEKGRKLIHELFGQGVIKFG